MKITPEKILFFDLDGTLIDTDYLNWFSYKKACEYVENKKVEDLREAEREFCDRGELVDNRLHYLLNFDVFRDIRENYSKFDYNKRLDSNYFKKGEEKCLYYDEIISKKREIYSKCIYFGKKIEENVSILKRFSKTNSIILVSNCRKTRGLETLKYHQLDKYFYRMFFLEDRMLSENKYENAIRELGVSYWDIIAFEDDDKEIENAQKVGIKDINVDIDVEMNLKDIDVEMNLKDVAYNIFEKFTDKLLFYQNNDAKIRIEVEKDTLEYLLKDREENIYIDENICYFPKKEGELFQPKGKKYRILKGGLKEFIIDPNLFLKQKIKGFYHKDYFSSGNWDKEGALEYLIWSLKNDEGCKEHHKQYLSTAYKRLKIILQRDLPKIKEKISVDSLVVCVVPRAKEGFVYNEDQLLFRKAVSDTVDKIEKGFINGTKYLVRHTSTKTTHLKQDNEGILPYIGITKDTCYISDNVIGKDILLIDDIYTKTVNIDEDAIQALLDKGARSVHFYTVGKTYSYK